jgi:hypothetical protein
MYEFLPRNVSNEVTNAMEQSPSWGANITQPVKKSPPPPPWNTKVYYRVRKSPPLVPVLSQLLNTLPPYFYKTHSNFIFLSTARSFKWSLLLRFYNQNIICMSHLSHVCYMSRQSHPSWFDHPNNFCWSVQIMNSSLCSLLQPPPIPPSQVQIFSKPLVLCSSLRVRDPVSHTYKTRGKIMFF